MVGVLDGLEFLREAVSVFGRLAASLAQVGHHGVGRVAANRHLAPGPALGDERSAVIEIAALDVLLGGCFQKLVGEVVPDVAVGIPGLGVVELVQEAGEL